MRTEIKWDSSELAAYRLALRKNNQAVKKAMAPPTIAPNKADTILFKPLSHITTML